MATVHFGKGRSMTLKDDARYQDPTLAEPPANLKTECVRLMFDRATHARLRLIAQAEHRSLADFIRRLAEDRARSQSVYNHGKHST